VREKVRIRRADVNLDDLLVQIQSIRSALGDNARQIPSSFSQFGADQLPTVEVIAQTFEEVSTALGELQTTNQELTAELERVNSQLRKEVAERQQFRAALSQRELEFKALVENAPDVIARYDQNFRHVYINPAVELTTGIPFQEFIGKNFQELGMPVSVSDKWNQALQTVFETSLEQEIEFQLLTPFGLKYYQSRLVLLATDGFETVLAIIRDITASKEVEAALVKSEQCFRTSFDNMLDCFAIYMSIRDQSGKIVDFRVDYLNKAVCANHSVIKELRVGQNLCEIFTAVRMTGLFDEYVNVVETGLPLVKEELIFEDIFEGERLTQVFDLRVVKLGDGLAVTWRDITERKQARLALQESEERFRQLAENINEVFWMVTPVSRDIIYISPAYDQIWGRCREYLCQNPCTWIESIAPQDRERVRATIKLQDQLIQNQGSSELEYRIIRPDGEVRWIRDRAFGVYDQQGLICRIVGIAEDITERKQAQQALQESEQRFRQLAESIREVFWMVTPDRSKLIYISPAYEEIWGRTCESLYKNINSWLESIHPLDLESVMTDLPKQVDGNFNQEYRILRPDGEMRWIHDRGFGVYDQNGSLYRVVGIAEDITGRKLAEFEACNALIKERELNDLKSRFVSMTSHEFRTPLTTIQSSAELLERYYHDSDPQNLRHLTRIKKAVAQMAQMLEDILIIGETESGKLEFKPVPLNLVEFCHNLVEELQLSHQTIIFNYQDNYTTPSQNTESGQLPQLTNSPLPLLDQKLLRHILSNLLVNALKYSSTNSLIQFNLSYLDNTAIFQIKDQGIGIPPEDLSRLFEPFHRATNVGAIQGTGLGLAIVKQCVDLHRGEITVDSVPGATTFTVKLPLSSSIRLS
jgi:PAS domain S-box-containing protein